MSTSRKTTREIRRWLVELLSRRLAMSPNELPTDRPLTALGLDSTEAVVVSGELQDWLERRVPPTELWDYPTIDAVAKHLGDDAEDENQPK